jgi:hypothetical protein
MPAGPSKFNIETNTRQWHDLAERRLAYYHELYRSGRWTHYFRSPEQFAARMLDVIKVAKALAQLTGGAPPQSGHPNDLRPAA